MSLLIGTDLKVSAVTEASINQTLKTLLMPVAQLEKKSLPLWEKKTSTSVAQKDKRLIGTDLLPSAVRPQRIKSSLTTSTASKMQDMPAAKLKKIIQKHTMMEILPRLIITPDIPLRGLLTANAAADMPVLLMLIMVNQQTVMLSAKTAVFTIVLQTTIE